jgi:cytochrome c556
VGHVSFWGVFNVKVNFRHLLLGAAALAAATTIGLLPVAAQDKAAQVTDRQASMKRMGQQLAGVKAFLDGNADQAAASANAGVLAELAAKIPDWFPPGTAMTEVSVKSAAKPNIWTDRAKFTEAATALKGEADKLQVALKGTDKAAVGQQFAAVGRVGCGGCHNEFREKQ